MNDSFREPVNDEPSVEHADWCVGGAQRSHRPKGACLCDLPCCSRPRGNGWVTCICTRCDGTCGAHLDDGPVTP